VAPLVEKAKTVAGDAARWFNFFDKLLLLALLYFEEKKVSRSHPDLSHHTRASGDSSTHELIAHVYR
jgi:hypothetical protein